MAHEVFISYASEDRAVADAVCAGLEKGGLRCWIAPRDILPAEQYDDAIIRAISTARVMVVIFSSNVFQSQYVKSEVERGFSKSLVIVPFRIEAIDPQEGFELYFGRTQWLDAMMPPLEAHILKLSSTIQAFLQIQQVQPPPRIPGTRPQISVTPAKRGLPRWSLLAGGIVLGVFLCVASVMLASAMLNQPPAPTPAPTLAPTPTQAVIATQASLPPQPAQRAPDLSAISPGRIDQSLPQVSGITAEERQALIETIVGADKAEIFAYFYRDDSYLKPYYDGAVLQQMQGEISSLINQKAIALSSIDLNRSYYPDVRMVGSSIIAIDACEYWQVEYYDDTSFAQLSVTPWTLVPQTINFELMGNNIKITSIANYQNSAFCVQ